MKYIKPVLISVACAILFIIAGCGKDCHDDNCHNFFHFHNDHGHHVRAVDVDNDLPD